MDGVAVEDAGAAGWSRIPWRVSQRPRQDLNAQHLDGFSGNSSEPRYITDFKKDIAERQKFVSGEKFKEGCSQGKDWTAATTKRLQNKYISKRRLGPAPHEDFPTFEGSITYLVKKPTDASDTGPKPFQPRPLPLGDSAAVMNILKETQALWEQTSQQPAIRWIHLPANNMEWVESVMSSVIATCRPVCNDKTLRAGDWNSMAQRVLQPRFWDNRCREVHGNPFFGRQMEPFATHIKVDLRGNNAGHSGSRVNVLVAFLPYLHWESSIAARYMLHVAEDVQQRDREATQGRTGTASFGRDMCQDESLLRRYLPSGHLHPRRTLDQFHYHDLKDTRKRDFDQVVERYAIEGHFDDDTQFEWEPPILMVDQCWVWAIGPDTVLTAFPHTWDCYDRHEDPIDLHKTLLVNIKLPIHRHFLHSAAEFARFVIRISAANMIQTSKYPREHDKLMLYFRHAIGDLRQQKTKLLEEWLGSLKVLKKNKTETEQILNVTDELSMLGATQDIIEELHMIRGLLSDQDESIRQFVQAQKKFASSESSQDNRPASRKKNRGFDMIKHPSTKARWTLLYRLREDAERLDAEISKLVERKIQQAGIMEAQLTRRLGQEATQQGETVKLFTVITITFLPVSTLATVFGINSKDFGSGSMSLGVIFAIIFPISVVCVIFSLWISLSYKSQEKLFQPIKDWLHDPNTKPDVETQSEASDDSDDPTPQNPVDRGIHTNMFNLSRFPTPLRSDNQHHPARQSTQETQRTFSSERLATRVLTPGPAISVLRRNDERTNPHRRKGRFRRRKSKMMELALEEGDDEDVALYTLSESAIEPNDDPDTSEED